MFVVRCITARTEALTAEGRRPEEETAVGKAGANAADKEEAMLRAWAELNISPVQFPTRGMVVALQCSSWTLWPRRRS